MPSDSETNPLKLTRSVHAIPQQNRLPSFVYIQLLHAVSVFEQRLTTVFSNRTWNRSFPPFFHCFQSGPHSRWVARRNRFNLLDFYHLLAMDDLSHSLLCRNVVNKYLPTLSLLLHPGFITIIFSLSSFSDSRLRTIAA